MAAAANHRTSMSAMSQTFLLTNICPQVIIYFRLIHITKPFRLLAPRAADD